MIVYSWNMLFRNQRLDDAFAFVRDADFDVFCLQEVPPTFFARLQELPYHLASAIDNERLTPPLGTMRLVILSKYPVIRQGAFDFPDYWPTLPLRTRLFVRLMRPFGWARIRNRQGLYADLDTPAGPIRVFDLHIILGTIEKRLREFERAMSEHDRALPAIICGDFNVIESLRVSLLNWLHGGPFSEVTGYRRERLTIEQRFVELELTNLFRGQITHAFARSQLDHILLSKRLAFSHAEIVQERHGSDHHPLRAHVT